MTDEPDKNRIYWHSRRGMLELDLVLMPFAKHQYARLSEADQQLYKRLLDCEDQDLFAWFMRRREAEDPALARMVEQILSFAQDDQS